MSCSGCVGAGCEAVVVSADGSPSGPTGSSRRHVGTQRCPRYFRAASSKLQALLQRAVKPVPCIITRTLSPSNKRDRAPQKRAGRKRSRVSGGARVRSVPLRQVQGVHTWISPVWTKPAGVHPSVLRRVPSTLDLSLAGRRSEPGNKSPLL